MIKKINADYRLIDKINGLFLNMAELLEKLTFFAKNVVKSKLNFQLMFNLQYIIIILKF